MLVTMDFSCKGAVLNVGQRCIDLCKLIPSGKELFQVLDRTWLLVVEVGGGVDFSGVRRAVGSELAEGIGVGCHEHSHILGWDGVTILIDDGEWDVIVLVIVLVPIRNRRLTVLDAYTPLVPRVVEPDRAFFCFSHTSSTSTTLMSSTTRCFQLVQDPLYGLSFQAVLFV